MKRILSLLLAAMMIFSCMSLTSFAEDLEPVTPAFALFTGTGVTESPNATAGSKVMLTVPGDGAVYYNNGVEIATTPGLAAGTVAVTVNPGINKYTATAGGSTYGPVTIYGFTPVYNGVGANIGKGAGTNSIISSDSVLVEANPEGLTNLIDENHTYAYQAGNTSTATHRFSSGMRSRTYYATAYGFYVNGTLAEGVYEERPIEPEDPEAPVDPEAPTTEIVEVTPPESFRILNFQAGANPYLAVYVGPQNHLYVRGFKNGVLQTGLGEDTGVVITPNVWHDLSVTVTWNIDAIASVYVDGILAAKVITKNKTDKDNLYHYTTMCASGKGYVGDAVTSPVFSSFPIKTGTSSTTKFGVSRNDYIDLPAATVTAEADQNTVTFSANIPEELAGAEAKILVNGAVANTMANGDKTVILSNTAIENATVTAAIVDAQGNVLTGLKGEPLTSDPITMNIAVQGIEPLMSDLALYDTVGAGFEAYPYAVAGNKVLVVPPSVVNFNESTMHIAYFSGETDVTASVVAGPFANTVAVPVVAGSKYITAKVLDTATGTVLADTNSITLYAQELSAGTEIDAFTAKSSNFTNVTETLTADLESTDAAVKAKAEALLADGRTVYQTKATASNAGAQIKGFVTSAAKAAGTYTTPTDYKDTLEISYDFYLDESFAAREGAATFNMFGFNTTTSAAINSTAGVARNGTYYRVTKDAETGEMSLYVGGVDTGVNVETGKWYNATYYLDAHGNRVDFYLDGLLVSKANVHGNNAVRDLDSYVVYPVAPFSGSTGGYNSAAYFSNATFNAEREYSYAPTISAVADDEANTLTVTLRDIDPATATAYMFMNGVLFPQAIPFTGETFVLEGLTGYADVYVAVLGADGTVTKGIFNDELKTLTFSLTDPTSEDVITNGMITDTGAVFGLLKRNIPAEYQAEPISIITINADGTIAVTPYTFGEEEDYKLFNIEGAGIKKVFVWNLGDLKSLDEAIVAE